MPRLRDVRRALALVLAASALVVLALAVLRPGDPVIRAVAPPAPPPVLPAPAQGAVAPDGLRLGLTEQQAGLLSPTAGDPALEPWRARVDALDPRLLRLLVDWSQLQPDAAEPPRWDAAGDGCMRGAPPCVPGGGVRGWLRAAAARDAEVLVSLYGTPAWAAQRPQPCERPGTQPRSRAPRADAEPAYRALLRSLLDLAAAEGARIAWVSPWNEPNGPYFLAAQRCGETSPATYARLFRAAREEAGGEAGLVLGELAGYPRTSDHATSVKAFVRALPRDVLCTAGVAAQHAYLRPDRPFDPVAAMAEVLGERRCTEDLPLWVTETGPGGAAGVQGRRQARSGAACRAYDRALRDWLADPRIEAAIHYTVREDPLFPVGLADPSLARATPAYRLLLAWARRPDRSAPPPGPPGAAC